VSLLLTTAFIIGLRNAAAGCFFHIAAEDKPLPYRRYYDCGKAAITAQKELENA
jgi:hypothetical protein